MYVDVSRLLFFLPRPSKPAIPDKPAVRQHAARSKRRIIMPAITPITMPAIAPGLRPLLLVVEAVAAPAEADAEGVWKGTVVVADPVEVTVVATLLVGRRGAVFVAVAVVICPRYALLLSPPCLLLATHWPAKAQYCPVAQHIVPQGLSPS